ncbi:hypothetical protein ACEPPN_013431 [Leptodophora sp. 'Broadleaf-Isolate-01']
MGPSDKRLLTQISVLALAGAKSPNKVTEHAVLFDSLGSTPKTDASTKKTVGSREGASESSTGTEKASSRTIRSAISGPLQLQRGNLHGRSGRKTLHVYRQLQHQNIITALEAFTTDNGLYIVFKYMPLSLERIVRSPAYLDDRQLAAILGQIVTGVAYLVAKGFEHGSFTCLTWA